MAVGKERLPDWPNAVIMKKRSVSEQPRPKGAIGGVQAVKRMKIEKQGGTMAGKQAIMCW